MGTERTQAFEELVDLLYEIGRRIHNYDNTARTYGTDDMLYMVEVHTVQRIGRKPGITITEIAENTNRTKGAVSQTIDKLRDKDILEKIKDPKDRRKNILVLTDKGKTIFEYHEMLDDMNYKRILSKMNGVKEEELIKGTEVLKKVFNVIKHRKSI